MTRFGPAGYPEAAKGSIERVCSILKEFDLDALEYAAVYGLRIKEEKAAILRKSGKENGISLSMHAAYYISLLSKKPAIRERSKQRLVKAMQFAPLMGVERIVFHAGGYSGVEKREAYSIVKQSITEVLEEMGKIERHVLLAPETSGKFSAFGSIDELVNLCSELDGVIPTIDWAHIYAKEQGQLETYEDYLNVLVRFEDALGEKFTDNMHFHASGITFTEKGEQTHKPLGMHWGPDLVSLMRIIVDNGYSPTFISETPNPVEGALYMKYLLEELEKVIE